MYPVWSKISTNSQHKVNMWYSLLQHNFSGLHVWLQAHFEDEQGLHTSILIQWMVFACQAPMEERGGQMFGKFGRERHHTGLYFINLPTYN